MRRLDRTAETSHDLAVIALYIVQDNPSAATDWLRDTEQLISVIAAQPQIGERVRTRHFGLIRRLSRGNYVIYYRTRSEAVEILRVLHGCSVITVG